MQLPTSTHVFHVLYSPRVGGAAGVAIKLSERLANTGQLGGVLVADAGPAEQALSERGLKSTRFRRDLIMSRNRLAALLGNASLGLAVGGWRRNIVHFHLPGLYRAARLGVGRCAAVVHVQIDEPQESYEWAFRAPPALIVPCARYMEPAIRAALPRRREESQRIEPLPNAVDVQRFAPLRHGDRKAAKAAVGAPVNRPLLLMMANLAPHKGQATAIRAVARLKSLGVDVACWLAGEDREQCGYEGDLAQLATTLGVAERVRLLGFRNDVDKLYAAADILLLPSTMEGLPLTILEAQAAGVVALAAPTAGVPEIINNGRTGWLIAADDHEGYAQRIRILVENPDLRASAADKAYSFVERHHSWTNFCDRMMGLYDSLLN